MQLVCLAEGGLARARTARDIPGCRPIRSMREQYGDLEALGLGSASERSRGYRGPERGGFCQSYDNDPACSRERDLNKVACCDPFRCDVTFQGRLSFLAGETYKLQWIAQPAQSADRIDSASSCNSPLYSGSACTRRTNASGHVERRA